MFTRSHLQEMKRRYASMYAPLIEEKFEEHCGVCGEQGIEEDEIEEGLGLQLKMAFDDAKIKTKPRKGKIVIAKKDKKKAMDVLSKTLPSKLKKYVDKAVDNFLVFEEIEIEEGTSLQVKMALDDVGLKGTWKNGKVYVKKRDVKKAEKALKGNVIYRDKPPVVVGEEVEIEEVWKDIFYAVIDTAKKGEVVALAPTEKSANEYVRNQKGLKAVKVKGDYKRDGRNMIGKKLSYRKEEVEMDEAKTPMYPPTIKNLRMIVKDKQNQVFMFKVGKARVDTFTASAIVAVYDGLKKPEHKKKLEDMIKTKEGFLKTQAFAMKMVK